MASDGSRVHRRQLSIATSSYREFADFEATQLEEGRVHGGSSNAPQYYPSTPLHPGPFIVTQNGQAPQAGGRPHEEIFTRVVQSPATNPAVTLDMTAIIDDFLYVGSEPLTLGDVQHLQGLSVELIINAAEECDDVSGLLLRKRFKWWKFGCRDQGACSKIAPAIPKAYQVIADAETQGRKIYVHCKAGRSRSITLVICYLIRSRAMTLKQAYEHVQARRPHINPNIGFIVVMRQWEKTQLNLKEASM